jgi:uncharacterized membrane protein YphA (DoxX/SURF4 family)
VQVVATQSARVYKLCKKLIPLVTSRDESVHNTFGIQKAASTFERAMTGRVMHSIAFLTLCAAYIQGGLSKLSNIATSLAEMEEFHLHPAGLYLAAVITTELVGSAMVSSGRGRWVGALWLAGFTFIANLLANAFWTVQGGRAFPSRTHSSNPGD